MSASSNHHETPPVVAVHVLMIRIIDRLPLWSCTFYECDLRLILPQQLCPFLPDPDGSTHRALVDPASMVRMLSTSGRIPVSTDKSWAVESGEYKNSPSCSRERLSGEIERCLELDCISSLGRLAIRPDGSWRKLNVGGQATPARCVNFASKSSRQVETWLLSSLQSSCS